MESNEARLAFAELLAKHRKRIGFSQSELADRAGMSRNGLSDLERGLRVPRKETIDILAEALKLGPEETKRFKAFARMTKSRDADHKRSAAARNEGALSGREDELEAIAAFLGQASSRAMLLEGPSGAGISRLLAEGSRIAEGLGWKAVELRHSRWSGLSTGELALRVREAAGGETASAWAADYSAIERLCTSQNETERQTLLGERRPILVREFMRALSSIADPAGVLLIVDDLQWSSEDGLSMLLSLCAEDSRPPIALLAGLKRSEAQAPASLESFLADLAKLGLVDLLMIEPLGEEESMRMAEDLARAKGLSLKMEAGELHSVSGGLPAFIECIVGDKDGSRPSSWVSTSVGQAWSAASERARHAAGLVAVAGGELPAAFLCRAMARLGVGDGEACEALEEDSGNRLLKEKDGRFACEPRLLLEALVEEMGAARRILYHKTLAEEYEEEGSPELFGRIAYHFEEAGLVSRALPKVDELGKRLEAEGKVDEAIRRYERALLLAGIDAYDAAAYRLLSRLLSLKQRRREFAYVEERTSQAIKVLQGQRLIEEQLPFQQLLMQCMRVQGKYKEAQERFASFTLVARELSPSSDLVKYLCEYSYLQYCLADNQAFERALRLAEEKAVPDLDDRARYLLENAKMRYFGMTGDYEATRETLENRIMPYTEAMGMEREYQTAALNLTHTLNCLGRFDEASSKLAEAERRMVILDSPQMSRARANFALHSLLRTGAWDELHNKVAELASGADRVAFRSEAILYGYRAAWYRRRDDEAGELLERAEKAGMMEEERLVPDLLRAERSFLDRDYSAARRGLEILELPPWSEMAGIEEARALRHAARALASDSEEERAAETEGIGAALSRATASACRPSIAEILFYRAWLGFELALPGAREDLEAALAHEEAMGRAYQRARALGLAALARLGDPRDAQAAFEALKAEAPWISRS
jgi:transcriptional regulator with XRE-family HTH domain